MFAALKNFLARRGLVRTPPPPPSAAAKGPEMALRHVSPYGHTFFEEDPPMAEKKEEKKSPAEGKGPSKPKE